jgi:hypothetical protein
MHFVGKIDGRIAYRYAVTLPHAAVAAGRVPAERPLIPYITTKTTERWTTIGNEGKSDLYVVVWEGWKDREEGRAGSFSCCPPGPPPRVGGWESLVIRRLHNRECVLARVNKLPSGMPHKHCTRPYKSGLRSKTTALASQSYHIEPFSSNTHFVVLIKIEPNVRRRDLRRGIEIFSDF